MTRKNVSEIQSAAGQIAALITEMLRLRDKLGVTPEEFHVLFTEAGEPHLEKMLAGLKDRPVSETPNEYLRQILTEESIVLGSTHGSRRIAQMKDMFASIHSDFFDSKFNTTSQSTTPIKVVMYEIIKEATIEFLLASGLGRTLGDLCFTQDQIIEFVIQHRDKLRCDFSGTLFLLRIWQDFCVVHIYEYSSGRLCAGIYSLYDFLPREGLSGYLRRLVVPEHVPLQTT